MNSSVLKSFNLLKDYCEKQGYKGWDPYDGLTSKTFQAIPFISKKRVSRLAWIQLFKRSPLNLRRLLRVKKSYNSKGLALFLIGYCNLYKTSGDKALLEKISFLAEIIIGLQVSGYSGACWGYYFDWQARAFFQPAHTPTVVATSFVTEALLKAYDVTGNKKYLDVAVSSADFVLKDLNRTYDEKGNFCFSYSPIDQTQVYNASLLGARLLSHIYYYTKNEALKEQAYKAVQYACDHQQSNGAWSYGNLPYHSWVDSFHTGFNLECIYEYAKYTGDQRFDNHLWKGYEYYINNFFSQDGRSNYYNNKVYPIDIHAPAQLIVTAAKLDRFNEQRALIDKVLNWTIKHMQHPSGYFYYQKKKGISSKIAYMRWAQAWMFYAMSYYLHLNEIR